MLRLLAMSAGLALSMVTGQWNMSEILPEEEVEVPAIVETVEKKLVALDAGHQIKGNFDYEPNGPGSSTMKYKVSSGTQGRFTYLPEYVLVLDVALKMEEVLLERGYEVFQVRRTHEVDISNVERAVMVNEIGADAFIRIHADGSEDASVNGAFTICMTPSNPYNANLYQKSYLLSEKLLDGFIAETGANRRNIWQTDTMTGINWCEVPVTIIEMGYMTNEREDRLMATEEYQWKMAIGMADGLDLYFAALEEMGL